MDLVGAVRLHRLKLLFSTACGVLLATGAAQAGSLFPSQPVFTSNASLATAISAFSKALNTQGSVSFATDKSVTGYLSALSSDPFGDFGPDCVLGSFTSTFKTPTCTFGLPNSSKTVVVIGDSIGGEWADPLSAIATARGWKLIVAVKPECLIADSTYSVSAIGNVDYSSCWAWRTALYQWLKSVRPYMIIVANTMYFQTTTPSVSKGMVPSTTRLLSYLSPAKPSHLVYLIQPMFGYYAGRTATQCLAANNLIVTKRTASSTGSCYTTVSGTIGKVQAFYNGMKKVATTAGAAWINPTFMFCDVRVADGVCPPVIDHSVVYRDQWHPSTAYLHRLSNVLAPTIPQ